MDYTVDEDEAANPVSVAGMVLLIIIDCILIFRGVCSGFCQVPPSLLKLLFYLRGGSTGTDKLRCSTDRNASPKMLPDKLYGVPTSRRKHADNKELSIGDVTMVMRRLGTYYDLDEDKLKNKLGSNDITTLFEEQEPSLQEVQEAFSMFDENNDGFIDAKELRKMLYRLCFTEVSEADCMRMIRTFDNNEDGVVDFHEFVRLVADSFN